MVIANHHTSSTRDGTRERNARLPKHEPAVVYEILEGIQVDGRPLYRRTQPTRNWGGESADDGRRDDGGSLLYD